MDADTLLRAFAALVWIAAAIGMVRHRRLLAHAPFTLVLVTSCLAITLTVIALGPTLAAVYGGGLVKGLYTATSTMLSIVGLALALTRSI